MSVIELQGRERSAALVKLHDRWTPTMEVSVWGNAKATRTRKAECRDPDLVGGQQYRGDCDNCQFFMGAKPEPGRDYYWGDYVKACCALDLEAQQTAKASA